MSNQLTKALALGSSCAACGAGRKAKNLRYDPLTFMPYCDQPHICSEDHPNSPINLIKRQGIKELVTGEEIKEAYQQHLLNTHVNSESAMKVHRLMIKPTTIRIMDPEMAEYLVNLQAEKELTSLAETIRYCLQVMMENKGTFVKEHRELKKEKQAVEKAEETVKELETMTLDHEPENTPVKDEGGWAF